MYPLAEQVPKALLPIANRPLIWYVIAFLNRHGFEEAIVISQPTYFDRIRSSVQSFITIYNLPIKLDYVCLPTEKHKEMGTADALRYIQPQIKSDLLILPCDILIDIHLQKFADIHRCYNSTLTVLLAPQTNPSSPDASGGAAKSYKAGSDIVAMAEDSERVLLLQNETEVDEKLSLTRSLLLKFPSLEVHTDLRDTHVYLMKRAVLDILNEPECKKISSIKEELIPLLLRRQLTEYKEVDTSFDSLANDLNTGFNTIDDLDLLALQLSESNRSQRLERIIEGGACKTIYYLYACYKMVLSGPQIARRVSTVQDYIEGNKLMQRDFTRRNLWPIEESVLVHGSVDISGPIERVVGSDTWVGENSSIAEGCSIKKSIIGPLTLLGKNVKVSNSIIMEKVVIEDNCQILNSVLCGNSRVESDSILRDCIVAKSGLVQKESDLRGETVVRDEMVFKA